MVHLWPLPTMAWFAWPCVRYVTIIRDPLDRIVSHFAYALNFYGVCVRTRKRRARGCGVQQWMGRLGSQPARGANPTMPWFTLALPTMPWLTALGRRSCQPRPSLTRAGATRMRRPERRPSASLTGARPGRLF